MLCVCVIYKYYYFHLSAFFISPQCYTISHIYVHSYTCLIYICFRAKYSYRLGCDPMGYGILYLAVNKKYA